MMSAENSLRCLADSLKNCGAADSSLIYTGSLCLGFKIKTRELGRLLPRICEHSDCVCIGNSYREIFSEHGKVIIKNGALKILSSH